MKAVTIWQPYASLIECRLKKYETRSWKTSYRGPLLIHSGQRPMRWILKHSREDALDVAIEQFGIDQLMQLPVGRAICVVDLVDCIEMTPEFIAAQNPTELAVGDWEPGRYAWKLANPRSVERVELIGKQGLWNIENTLIRRRCCFCGTGIDRKHEHNPVPAGSGVCCEKCNSEIVIPARIAASRKGGTR